MRLFLLSLLPAIVLAACSGPAPQVKVLGVSEAHGRATPVPTRARELLVFVEVVNPTARDLQLSHLEYRLEADAWFASDGKVPITRAVAADSSMVVEIPVPLRDRGAGADSEVEYTLEGRLFVLDKQMERSWPVQVRGTLKRDQVGSGHPVRIRVADVD